jgi:hypothetical protein
LRGSCALLLHRNQKRILLLHWLKELLLLFYRQHGSSVAAENSHAD